METLQQRVARHEGRRLVPYQDSLGFWTVGFGHKIQPGERFTVITQAEAYNLLNTDLQKARDSLIVNLPWVLDLPALVREVMIELVFQLGIYGFLQFRETIKCIHSGDFYCASKAMLASRWAEQTPARAKELSDLVNSTSQPMEIAT